MKGDFTRIVDDSLSFDLVAGSPSNLLTPTPVAGPGERLSWDLDNDGRNAALLGGQEGEDGLDIGEDPDS